MIKSTNYTDNKLILNYSNRLGEGKQDKPLKVKRNIYGSFVVGGTHIGKEIMCDGDELCGEKATHMITVLQYHEVSFCSERTGTITSFRNPLLLCNKCLELYKKTDVMIGEPVNLDEWRDEN